jgi:dienelactone hydrolase
MKRAFLGLIALLLLCGCETQDEQPAVRRKSVKTRKAPPATVTLTEARRGFRTRLLRRQAAGEPVPEPPAEIARLVRYDAPAGKLSAYITLPSSDAQRQPAIIWISGGDSNTIDDSFFEDAPADNDQTASAFRKAGVITMYPSLRGGNDNPGARESFLGEVDDVLAALDFLESQDFVDPKRIYLGGHSSGGTLVLLVAASSDRFRAVFSFGPIDDVAAYGEEYLPFNLSNRRELELRAPVKWLHSIRSPTFVFEGAKQPGNLESLQALRRASRNKLVHCYFIRGGDHFSILAPLTTLIAERIIRDTGAKTTLEFEKDELRKLFAN